MITLIVTYPLTGSYYDDEMSRYSEMAPNKNAAGLVRADHLVDQLRGIGGACCTFNSREDADAWFNEKLVAYIIKNYLANLKYFATPVVAGKKTEGIDETRYKKLQEEVLDHQVFKVPEKLLRNPPKATHLGRIR